MAAGRRRAPGTSGLRAAFLLLCLAAATGCAAAPAPSAAERLAGVEAELRLDPANMQLLFEKGMLLSVLGRPLQAADVFRQMLSRDPTLLRPRLELGRVLAQAGDNEGARYHFEQVLAHPLPDAVRRNVLNFLARIREELPAFSFSFDLVSDSNPNQATSNEEVIIDGVSYRLNADARARQSFGWRAMLGGRAPLPGAPLWFVRAHLQHDEHRGREFDFSYLQATAGRHLRLSDATLTLEAGHHWARYRQEALYAGPVVSLTLFRPLRPDLSLQLGLGSLALDYPDYPFRDGWQTTASARLLLAAAPDRRWELAGHFTRMAARESAYSFDRPQLSARYVREWAGGWITGTGVRTSWTHHAAADPFFRRTRAERSTEIDADLVNRRLRLWRMSPRLQLGWVDNRSNIDFFDWRRAYVRLGMSGEF